MRRDNVVLFPQRPPSKQELDVYRWMTRSWSPALRQLILPRYYYWANLSTPRGEEERQWRC
jgi:hypothetical protein